MLTVDRVEHRIVKKLEDGKFMIAHTANCGCQLLHSVAHAPWVTYDQMDGVISCDHCGTKVDLPCPSIRQSRKTVVMYLEALEDDLWKFQLKHENCPERVKLENGDSTLGLPGPDDKLPWE